MQVELVLTVIAEDRPGLVEQLAQEIADHSGNWVDSAMSRLGGSFAGIVKVMVPDEFSEGLENALLALRNEGFEISIRRGQAKPATARRQARLELIGQDHTGIVLQVTHLLASLGVNVEEMETSVFTASMSGERMFRADANIALPEGKSLDTLRVGLEELAQDLMVEITLKDDAG